MVALSRMVLQPRSQRFLSQPHSRSLSPLRVRLLLRLPSCPTHRRSISRHSTPSRLPLLNLRPVVIKRGGNWHWKGRLTAAAALLALPLVCRAQPEVIPSPAPSATTAATPLATGTPFATVSPAATPVATPKPATKPIALSAQAYRSRLQAEIKALDAIDKRAPRNVTGVLKRLDTVIDVRRADGQVQQVKGNVYADRGKEIAKPTNAQRADVKALRNLVEQQLKALDEWLATPSYQSIDGKKIIADLESKGEIRTGALWWQQMITDAWKAIGKAWQAFVDWINGLLPTPATPKAVSAPSDQWLWGIFYVIVAAILAAVIWFTWRAFGGVSWNR
ncbi:MAG: hypothetical protein EOP02_38625, partial [Proteobacteria bacterium]